MSFLISPFAIYRRHLRTNDFYNATREAIATPAHPVAYYQYDRIDHGNIIEHYKAHWNKTKEAILPPTLPLGYYRLSG